MSSKNNQLFRGRKQDQNQPTHLVLHLQQDREQRYIEETNYTNYELIESAAPSMCPAEMCTQPNKRCACVGDHHCNVTQTSIRQHCNNYSRADTNGLCQRCCDTCNHCLVSSKRCIGPVCSNDSNVHLNGLCQECYNILLEKKSEQIRTEVSEAELNGYYYCKEEEALPLVLSIGSSSSHHTFKHVNSLVRQNVHIGQHGQSQETYLLSEGFQNLELNSNSERNYGLPPLELCEIHTQTPINLSQDINKCSQSIHIHTTDKNTVNKQASLSNVGLHLPDQHTIPEYTDQHKTTEAVVYLGKSEQLHRPEEVCQAQCGYEVNTSLPVSCHEVNKILSFQNKSTEGDCTVTPSNVAVGNHGNIQTFNSGNTFKEVAETIYNNCSWRSKKCRTFECSNFGNDKSHGFCNSCHYKH